MIYKILAILAVLVIAVLIYASTKPDDFRYERSIVINAAPEKIFPYLNNTKKASEWSPWEKLDPDMKKTYSGKDEGVGAIFEWNGNSNVGSGRIEITESVKNEKVVMKLDFYKPFKAQNMAEYNITPQGNQSLVTWSMYGPNTFMGKIISVFMDCEKMIGEQFDKGLADLKALAEK